MTKQWLILVGASAAFWLLTAWPARILGGGELAPLYIATGLILCLLPAGGTLWWARSFASDPAQQVLIVLAATGVRIIVVLLAGLVFYLALPLYHHDSFWIWLLVAYLFILAVETTLLTRG